MMCSLIFRQAAATPIASTASARPPSAGHVQCAAVCPRATRQRFLRLAPAPTQATSSMRQPLPAWLSVTQPGRFHDLRRSVALSAASGAVDAPPASTTDRMPLTPEALQAAGTCNDVLLLAAACPAQQLGHLAVRMMALHFDSMTPPRASQNQLSAERAAFAALLTTASGQLAQLGVGTCLQIQAVAPAMQVPASKVRFWEQQAVHQVEAMGLQGLCAQLPGLAISGHWNSTPAAVLDALRVRLAQALPQAGRHPEQLAVLLCSGSQLGLLGEAGVQAAAQVAAGLAPEQLADTIAACGLNSRQLSVEATDVLRDAALAALATASPVQTALLVHSWSALGGQLGKAEDRDLASKARKGAQLLLGVKPGIKGRIKLDAGSLVDALSASQADGSWQTSSKAHQMVAAHTLAAVLPEAAPHDVARLLALISKLGAQVSGTVQLQAAAEAALLRCLRGAGAKASVMSSQKTLDSLQAWIDCGWQLGVDGQSALPDVFRQCVTTASAAQLTQLVQSCSALRMQLSAETALELKAALIRNQGALSAQQFDAMLLAAVQAGWRFKDMSAALEPELIRLLSTASPSDVAKLLQAWCKAGVELAGLQREVAAKALMRSLPGKARGVCMSDQELADLLTAADGKISKQFGKSARIAVRTAVMKLLPTASPPLVVQLLCAWKERFRGKLTDAASAAVLRILPESGGPGVLTAEQIERLYRACYVLSPTARGVLVAAYRRMQ